MNAVKSKEEFINQLNEKASHIERTFVDFDGVVINSEPRQYEAYALVLEKYGVDFSVDFFIEKCLGKPSLVNVRFLIEHFDLPISDDELVKMHSEKAVELISKLELNWFILPLVQWSNDKGITPNIISAGMEENINELLKGKNVRDKFGEIYSMHSKPETLTKQDVILDLTNGDASKSLIIEDSKKTLDLLGDISMFRIAVWHQFNRGFDIKGDIYLDAEITNEDD